jgi:hypothetical protein
VGHLPHEVAGCLLAAMNSDTIWWILAALIAGAVLVWRYVLRARDRRRRPDTTDASTPLPSPPPRSSANGAGLARAPSEPAKPAQGSRVASVEVIPGKLVVNIFAHTLNAPNAPVACWSYVSDGLWPLGQKEIVFTIARRKGEPKDAYPRDLLQLYSIVHKLAGEGRLVDVGDYSGFGGVGLLDQRDFIGLLYTPPQVLSDVHITAPSLIALILTKDELAVAQQQGPVRFMAMLGKHYRYFPTAPWLDRDRPALCSPADTAESLVAKAPCLFLQAASVRQESQTASREQHAGPGRLVDQTITFASGKQCIVLRLRPGAAEPLKKALDTLPEDSVLALLVAPDPSAPACLSWEPGQEGPFAISKPDVSGACIAGNFVVFLPQQGEDGGTVIEDGFAVFLRDETWQRIRAALSAGQPLSVPAADEERLGLQIVWLPALDPDFADPLESHVDGGWGVFGGNLANSKPVYVKSISLLTIVDLMERRVDSTALSTYINEITATVESHLPDAPPGPGQDLGLECEVRADGGRTFDFWVRPGKADDALEALRGHLMELPPPVVIGPIRFQINIQLRGGSSARGVGRAAGGSRIRGKEGYMIRKV